GLLRREAVLELVAGLRQGERDGVTRVAGHPAERLGCDADGEELCRQAQARLDVLGRTRDEEIRKRRREDDRADEMAAAALVLLRAVLAVLVRADRDVLGAVVGGEVGAAQREERRREPGCGAGDLAR